MKHFIFTITLLITSVAGASRYRFLADPWCPMTCDPQLGFKGYMIDTTVEILAPFGKEVDYKLESWNKAIENAREAKAVAIVGALKSDAPDFIFPEKSIAQQKSCFYKLKSSKWKYVGTDSLASVKLGLVSDYKYGNPVDNWLTEMTEEKKKQLSYVEGVGTAQKLFEALKAKKIDVLIEDESVVDFLSTQPNQPLSGIDYTQVGCLEAQPLYVAFSPKHPASKELAMLYDKGYAKFIGSKKFSEIKKKYSIK